MATVRDVLTDALVELGVLAAGETMATADADTGLVALNRLVDQWAAERLQIYTITRTVFTITSGTQTYTVGTAGTVAVARPIYLDHLAIQDTTDSPTVETILAPLTDDAYAYVTPKGQTAAAPSHWYYNPTFPLGTITLWPSPTGTTLQGVLYAPAAVAEFATLDTAISLPPGYRRMLVKNVALELAPSYEKQISGLLMQQAEEAKSVVKRSNSRRVEMSFEPGALVGSGGAYDIRTD